MSVRQRKWRDKSGKPMSAWVVDVVMELPTGESRRIQKTSPVNTKVGAQEYERQLRNNLLAGTYKQVQQELMTLAQFEARFVNWATVNNKRSELTSKLSILKHHLVPAFGTMSLASIGLEEIEEFKASKLKAGLAGKSVNNYLSVLSGLLTLAVEYKALDHMPPVRWLKLAVPDFDFLHFDEAEKFLAASVPRWRPMQTVALRTGMRIGELLALHWDDVDLPAQQVRVWRSLWRGHEGSTKSGKERIIGLAGSAVLALRSLTKRGAYVFAQADGSRLTYNRVKRVTEQTCTRAGLTRSLSWHDLRHTFASHLAMRGVPLRVIQELLGHSSIAMTERYAHLSPNSKRDAVQLLDLEQKLLDGSKKGEPK